MGYKPAKKLENSGFLNANLWIRLTLCPMDRALLLNEVNGNIVIMWESFS